MNILVLSPPVVPSYFNAGHHLPIFQVSNYLRAYSGELSIEAIDASSLNVTWKDLADKIYRTKVDIAAIHFDFDSVDTIERLLKLFRSIRPNVLIICFGRMVKQTPDFFKQFSFDALHIEGDYECGVASYVSKQLSSAHENVACGVLERSTAGWVMEAPGEFLDASDWVLPNVYEIPYAHYDRLYARDQNKFCGIPERRELVVPVARGCPVNCHFCDVPTMQGRRERRITVERTVKYIVESFRALPFEYVSIYAPTFTLKRAWVVDFCEKLLAEQGSYPWKCVTTLFHLDEQLIRHMASAGCVRISIGLETLHPRGWKTLPVIKQNTEAKFLETVRICSESGIELNCFIVLGLPGDTLESVQYTIELARRSGCRIRPTVYTDYSRMEGAMSVTELSEFNRQIPDSSITDPIFRDYIIDAIFGDDFVTSVPQSIPLRGEKEFLRGQNREPAA